MSQFIRPLSRLMKVVIWAVPSLALAAAGKVERIVVVADSRRYTGWQAWFINLYNESLILFTLLTVVSIPVLGMMLGTMADLAMKQIGINLKSRSVGEH